MRVALIGYRRHSARILGLLASFDQVAQVAVFHPDPAKLVQVDLASIHPSARPTSDVDDVRSHDAVLIASPTETHVPYIDELIEDVPYLFCEKPPAATDAEVQRLGAFETSKKRRLHFNFNYRFSALGKQAREAIDSGRLGRPLHFDFASAHGLAFKPGFKDDWRAKPLGPLSGIFGNVGVHYVDLCLWLLGDLEEVKLSQSTSSSETRIADSASAFLRFRNGATASIFTSYAAPFVNQARLVFNDGFLTLDDGRVRLFTPRETFDSTGLFATPPATDLRDGTSREFFDESLRESLSYFLNVASSGGSFNERDFDLSVRSNAVVLSATAG